MIQPCQRGLQSDSTADRQNTIAPLRVESDPRLSFIGHTTNSLWSVDLFRCESIVLRSYWVLVVMDQFTRRLVGFGVHCGVVTGLDVCRMFNSAVRGQGSLDSTVPNCQPIFSASEEDDHPINLSNG
ncbi:MAG: hypothetical protein Udaeo2_32100 [Candidatus Udaeobacter sp.]|jgi:transposase InsO family protein|nr:MAG: hypothetical protein Udaeo2_32100 [Candidatus Udaeobacter sp.]